MYKNILFNSKLKVLKVKIGFFISGADYGGGFHQTLGLLNVIKKIKNTNHDFIFLTDKKKILNFLRIKKYNAKIYEGNIHNRIYWHIIKIKIIKILLDYFGILSHFSNFIKNREKIDLLIFTSPSYLSIYTQKINYVISFWNTEIKKYNFFPEFLGKSLSYQEKIISNSIKNAYKILVTTKTGKKELCKDFNCSKKKIEIQNLHPYLPYLYNKKKNYKKKFYNLRIDPKKKWYYFPASFWAHKNHIYILNCLNILKKKKKLNKIGFIFTGSDKGHLNLIKKKTETFGLKNNILFLKYLNNDQIISIYKNCEALVMPTFIGRSSLPFLEGIFFKKKIFYGKGILDKEYENFVNVFDLKNPNDLANLLTRKKTQNKSFKIKFNNICSETKFLATYDKIINEFSLTHKKVKIF